jgi:hypothetical protein
MKIFTFSTQKCFFIGNLLNYKLIALGLMVLLGSGGVWGQNFSDNASNYSSWTNGSNQGTGFGAWAFTTGTNSGSFLGNPANNGMGTTGIGTNAFGMYATGSGYMNALRPFSSAMEVGDKFSFYWAINWDANGGGKGFDLKSGGTTIFNVNNFNSSTITTTNGNAFTNYGTSPMLVTLIRTSSTQYSFRMTARDGGSDYTTTINSSSQIDRINFYIGNQNNSDGNRNMFFNHLTIEKGRYRSKVSGAWNNASTWQVSTDGGSTWADANSAPSNSNGPITILNTHEVTVSTTITIDQTTIDAGGKVILATSGAITVANGADANDFTINGVYERQASATTMTPTGAVYCGSGSTYIHNVNGGALPTITWHSNSTLQIDQSVSNNEFTETFGNVTINGSSSFSMYNGGSVTTMNIAGNLTFNSSGTVYIAGPACNATQTLNVSGNYSHTGAGSFICRKYSSTLTFNVSGNFSQSAGIFTLGAPSGTFNYNGTITVTGDLSISGGQFNIHKNNASSSSINNTVNVNGNFSMSGGGLLFSDETGSGGAGIVALLNVKGNFTHTSGTITESATDAAAITRIVLNGTTGTQTLESTGQTGTIDFNVAASGSQCVIAASKTFTLSTASKMTVGAGTSVPDLSVSGIFVNSSTTTLGTTATTGTWAINNGGNFVHNSSAGISTPLDRCTLNSGSTFTYRGNGTPSAITPSTSLASGRTYHHLIFESTSGAWSATANSVTALIVNGNLTVGSGVTLNFSNTGTPTPANSIKGNLSVAGTLNFSPASAGTVNLNGSSTQTISGAGTITTGSNATLAVGASSTIDFGATIAIAGSGTFTTASGSTLITANTSGINGSLTLTNKSLNAGTNYTFNGSSAQVTGNLITAAGNLTLNNSNGLTLSAGTSVTGTLTLTSGKLTTNGFTLVLSNAVSGASSSNYIVADATGTATFNGVTTARVFPLGTASAYAPMTVTAGSSTNYTAYVTGTSTWPGSCTPTTTSQMVNLAWGLSGSNIPSQVVFQWPAGSQAGSFAPATSCDLGRYNTSCPYNVTNISAASGSGPYTLTCTTGLGSTSNIYVIGNQHAVYIAAPTVTTTVAASSITNTTASSGGQTLSGTNITSKGVVWNTATAPTVALSTKTNDGTGSSDFTSSITSLSPETLHYIRAFATNAAGTGYGDEKTFRTLSNPATVQASGFSATATSASNIDLSWTGATFPVSGATNKNYVLLRAASPNSPLLGNSNGAAPTAGANTTIVSSVIAENATSISSSGLAASTQYNYLLIPYTWDGSNATTYNYLTTSAPTANATTQSGSTPPVLTTNAGSSVLSTTATLNGEITADGGASVSARGFVYSTSDNTPTLGEGGVTDQSSGSGTGTFNSNVSSLPANTTHYYQAYATNTSGTSYGGVISFTTLKAEPSAQATSLVFSSVATTSFSTAFTAATGSPDGYIVIRSTSSSLSADPVDGTTYTAGNSLGGGTVVSVGSTISGIANSSLSAGTTYYMYVFSYNNSGSNINYLTTSPLSSSTITLTGAPTTPTFSIINTTSFTVDWTATTGASSYGLDVSTASDFSSYVSGYQDLTVNTTSQAVTGLTANTLYYARIRAVNNSGTSANSSTGNSATLSNTPTVSTASSITATGLTANWSAPSSQGAVTFTYTIELSTANDFSTITSTVSSIASGTTSNAFTSLSEGTTYYYRIKAVNSAGSSTWSSVSAGATTLTSSISLTTLGTAVTQDFNSLATSGTSSTLPSGWYLSESGSSANSTLSANDGSASSGETYSYGTSTNSDRAFGGLRSGSVIPTIGAKFQNSTGSVINNLSISYIGEQWRLGSTGRNDRLDFQYSLDATSISSAGTWTDVNSLDFSGPISSGTTGALSGNSSSNRTEITHTITGLTIADGAIFYIRWSDVDATGADDGLAVDDFSVKPCGTVSAPTASDQAFCSAVSPTVASLTVTGTAPQWYSASTGGTALSSSTALTNSTTYYATQTIGGCESVTRTPVVVTVNTNPSAPTGSATQTLCSGATVAELSASGSTIQWYSVSSGGSALATNTALVNSSTYYASQTTNSCESTTRFAATAAIVSSGTWIGGTSTDWSNSANWCGGVPTSSTNVTIPSGTANSAVISSNVSINSLTINSGATLSTSGTPTITIANNGSFTNNGTFTAGTSKVSFAGNGTVSGTVSFNDVDIAGGVNFGTASTVNGTLSMNANSFINTNAPSYGSGSTLKYNTGGTYGRSSEWSATSGAGAPHSVQISNSTTLNYPNTGNGGANAFSTNLSLAGNLTVDNSSALYMDWGGNANKSGRLDISGNVLLNGNLSLGNASGGDIKVGGNWTRNSGSTLNTNNRAVFFTGSGTSTITGNGGETFTYIVNEKTGGNISLGNNLTLTAPNGGNALTHKSTASIDLNNYSLTFSGPENSNVLADGSCSITGIGNVLITSNTKNLTGQNSGSWTFGSNVNLKLQSGLNFGTNLSTVNGTLEISSGGFVSGNGRPSYGVGSTLKYNSTGTYGRNTEWLSGFSSGAGVPYNVLISAGTTLDPGANSNFSSESWVRNELTIDGTFDMSLTDQVEPINVLGNVTFNNGTLKLSTTAGGDLKLGGNWSGTGTFVANSRAVYINGTGNQTISRNDIFPFLIIDKASGTLTIAGNITLNNKLTYSGGSISFSGGSIDASGASAEVEFANSSTFTLPTGLLSNSVNKLTLNGTGGITLSENVTVTNSLKLTSGVITLGSRNLTLTGGLDATGNGNSSSYINTSGSGALIRSISTTGVDYKFPVGLSNYSPISVNFTGGTISSSTLASRAVSGLHPNATDGAYIRTNLFWEMNQTGMTNPQYNVSFTYPGVTNGMGSNEPESNLLPAKWSASTGWLSSGSCSVCFTGTTVGTSSINTATKTITWNGVTGFSDFGGFGQGNGSPLPVELSSFSASCDEDAVTLSWSTASEQNSSHFDVEKSTDGENWRVIGTVLAAGNSTQEINYSFIDSEKSIDQNYYRLNQVDIDGKNEYFGPITVACEEDAKINTYPNPSKGEFNLVMHSKTNEKVTLKISDGNSRVISTKVLDLQNGINLFPIRENLSSGVYHIQLISESGKTTVLKHSVY